MVGFNVTVPQDGIYGIAVKKTADGVELGRMTFYVEAGTQVTVETIGATGFVKQKE